MPFARCSALGDPKFAIVQCLGMFRRRYRSQGPISRGRRTVEPDDIFFLTLDDCPGRS